MTEPADSEHSLSESSILILADGKILARNVSPRIAELLRCLSPDDPELTARSGAAQVDGPATHFHDNTAQT